MNTNNNWLSAFTSSLSFSLLCAENPGVGLNTFSFNGQLSQGFLWYSTQVTRKGERKILLKAFHVLFFSLEELVFVLRNAVTITS